MYQMTLFKKKVIYKKKYDLINTHQKISNCIIFFQIFYGEHAPKPP